MLVQRVVPTQKCGMTNQIASFVIKTLLKWRYDSYACMNTEDLDCSVCDRNSKANDGECKTCTVDRTEKLRVK